jgi:tetratricopeptide (TPR) repeat protein
MNFGFYNDFIKHYNNQPYDEIAYWNDLIRFYPTEISYYIDRGTYYMFNKKYYEAIEDFSKYIESGGSDDAIAWVGLAFCLFYVEDYSKASICWENAKVLKTNVDPTVAKNFEESLNYALQKQSN